MKRTARTFVVERRNGRKARPWFSEQPAVSGETETSAAVREANGVFRPRNVDGDQAKTGDQDAGIRVLPDLRDNEPALEQSAPPRASASRPKVHAVADATPRRPRGRPRKVVPVAGELAATDQAGASEPLQSELQFQTELPGLARRPVAVEPRQVPATPVFVAETVVSDPIVEAVMAKVEKRVARTGRVTSAADLPVGQRWKRRLHPASW